MYHNCPNCGAIISVLKQPPSGIVEELWNRLSEWSNTEFGDDRVEGVRAANRRLVVEVNMVVGKPRDRDGYVRLLLYTIDCCRRAGISYQSLVEEAFVVLAGETKRLKNDKNDEATDLDWRVALR